MKKNKVLGCEGGLTVQFLLGFVLILSFMSLFFMMTLTLAVSEIIQYITFASSRQLFLSNVNEAAQKQLARDKYEKLTTEKFKFDFNSNTLMKITSPDEMELNGNNHIGLNNDFKNVVQNQQHKANLFYGVWANFTPKILSVNTLWGSTKPDDDPNIYFKTTIGSYLGREPTKKECEEFNNERWNKINRLHNNTGNLRPSSFPSSSDDGLQSDNGC